MYRSPITKSGDFSITSTDQSPTTAPAAPPRSNQRLKQPPAARTECCRTPRASPDRRVWRTPRALGWIRPPHRRRRRACRRRRGEESAPASGRRIWFPGKLRRRRALARRSTTTPGRRSWFSPRWRSRRRRGASSGGWSENAAAESRWSGGRIARCGGERMWMPLKEIEENVRLYKSVILNWSDWVKRGSIYIVSVTYLF